jgi:hypothetical protein
MGELRLCVYLAALVVGAVAFAGCGSSASEKGKYTAADVRAAYFRAKDAAFEARQYWADPDFHSMTNYVPLGGIEACPLAQRATGVKNAVEPTAGDPVQLYVVAPRHDDDGLTPTIVQGALLFPTDAIAERGMEQVAAAVDRCPRSYDVRGGPSPILGKYSVSVRPTEVSGWKGIAQQVAHTYQADDVYYEDMAHVILRRGNVILFLDFDHKQVIGDRSDAVDGIESVAKVVLERLG